jgi:hypothetical protein
MPLSAAFRDLRSAPRAGTAVEIKHGPAQEVVLAHSDEIPPDPRTSPSPNSVARGRNRTLIERVLEPAVSAFPIPISPNRQIFGCMDARVEAAERGAEFLAHTDLHMGRKP